MTDVASIGECMIELKQAGNGLLSRGYGGDTLNTAVYLARLGVAVDYITALGDDPLSDEMLSGWAAEGVGTGLVPRLRGKLPGLYLIETDPKGERRFFHWRDSAAARSLLDLPETDSLLASLAGYDLVCLSEQRSPLTMSNDDISDIERSQHRSAHLSCECTAFLPVHILRANPHGRYFLGSRYQCRNRRECRDDYDFDVIDLSNLRKKRLKIGFCLSVREVHFPIGRQYFLPHGYFSVSAATPGSSFPSKSSSDAPPPVEMKVIFSA